jgi:hypothetical protein
MSGNYFPERDATQINMISIALLLWTCGSTSTYILDYRQFSLFTIYNILGYYATLEEQSRIIMAANDDDDDDDDSSFLSTYNKNGGYECTDMKKHEDDYWMHLKELIPHLDINISEEWDDHTEPFILDLDLLSQTDYTTRDYVDILDDDTVHGVYIGSSIYVLSDRCFKRNCPDLLKSVPLCKAKVDLVYRIAKLVKEMYGRTNMLDVIDVSAFGMVFLMAEVSRLMELGCTTILRLNLQKDAVTDMGVATLGIYLESPLCTLCELCLTGLDQIPYNKLVDGLSLIYGESNSLKTLTIYCTAENHNNEVFEHCCEIVTEPITAGLVKMLGKGRLGANLEHLAIYGIQVEACFVEGVGRAVKNSKKASLRLSMAGYYEHPYSSYRMRHKYDGYVRVMPVSMKFHDPRCIDKTYQEFSAYTDDEGQIEHMTLGRVLGKFEHLKVAWLSQLRELCCHMEKGWVERGTKSEEDDLDRALREILVQEEVDLWFRFLTNKAGELFCCGA